MRRTSPSLRFSATHDRQRRWSARRARGRAPPSTTERAEAYAGHWAASTPHPENLVRTTYPSPHAW